MTTFQVNSDPRFGINENLFSLTKKHSQIEDDGCSGQDLFSCTDGDVEGFCLFPLPLFLFRVHRRSSRSS